MPTETVTLSLPGTVMNRARQTAQTLQRPLEEVLSDMLASVLPDLEDVPAEMQADLADMTWLDDQALWSIAHGEMPEAQQEQLAHLSEAQGQRLLTQEEEARLAYLRGEYGRVMLRKARAYALLSLRSGRPLLATG